MSSSSSLHVALSQAIYFLTRPLLLTHPAATLNKLQLLLEANLTALYAPSWCPNDPARGSGRRCLTLSPNCLPPRAVYMACTGAEVQWSHWIMRLSEGREFDLLVDPGRVAVRMEGNTTTVWSAPSPHPHCQQRTPDEDQLQARLRAESLARLARPRPQPPHCVHPEKTFAQQVLEEDANDENELFAMLADEISVPTWLTPTQERFPKYSLLRTNTGSSWLSPMIDLFPSPPTTPEFTLRSISPVSTISSTTADSFSTCSDTRSTSRLSFSYSDSDTSSSSPSSSPYHHTTSLSPPQIQTQQNQQTPRTHLSRRERARLVRSLAYVDSSKKAIISYDMGKVGVLTGGVMLGGTPKAPFPPSSTQHSQRTTPPRRATSSSALRAAAVPWNGNAYPVSVPSWRRTSIPQRA